jgi:hypothetical protein
MSTILMSTKQGGMLTQYEVVNFSTAKQKYTFSRSPRFPSVQRGNGPKDKIQYDLVGIFDGGPAGKRAPSFGIGDRFKDTAFLKKSIHISKLNF